MIEHHNLSHPHHQAGELYLQLEALRQNELGFSPEAEAFILRQIYQLTQETSTITEEESA